MSGTTIDRPRGAGPIAAAPSGSIWEYLSPSRLNCWLSCPLKFRFRYVEGLHVPPTPSLLLGQQVHRGLEYWYRRRMDRAEVTLEETVAETIADWDRRVFDGEVHLDSPAEEARLRGQAGDLVRAYLEQVPADEPRPLAVESRMSAPLVDPAGGEPLGLPLLGIADLVLPGEQGPVIVDFKTAARAAPPLEITHEIQLTCYAWLYRQLTGEREAALEIRSLIKTKAPRVATHRYPSRTEADFRRLFAVVREYLEVLDRGRLNYRPGFGCGMCEFREGPCAAWEGHEAV